MNRNVPEARAVYLHIPFCQQKCHYCDFNTYAVQGQPVDEYLDALEREMERTVELYPPDEIRSIFVGGGTPTILSPQQMERFLSAVARHFPVRSDDCEFTMEANPGTTDSRKLEVMRAGGVNRISFGAQAFQDHLLRTLGRIHRAEDVRVSVELARRAGFSNISVDLMFGLPRQTLAELEESVERALELDLPHLSLYSLKIEENTLFHTLYERNELPLPDEDTELNMYLRLIELLTDAGYNHYEISNFARDGRESVHNMAYWRNQSYYGLGAGAHGYLKGVRHVNVRGIREYIRAAQTGLPVAERHEVDDREAMEDFMMVGLRMLGGVSPADFREQFGMELEAVFARELEELIGKGLLELAGGKYRLTRQAIPVGNEVFARFIS